MNNRAVREAARGDYVCLLNNDAAPLDGGWLGEMMALARRPDVGAVGAKLIYPDGRIQHAGVDPRGRLGRAGRAPVHIGDPGNSFGYWGRLQVVQDFSAVTAACLVTRRAVYEEVGGLDEEVFAVAYNDVDYCLKVGAAGYLVVWTPVCPICCTTAAPAIAQECRGRRRSRRGTPALPRERTGDVPAVDSQHRLRSGLQPQSFFARLRLCRRDRGGADLGPGFPAARRVIAYPADREGCGEYRIIAPSRALINSGRMHSYETMRLSTPPELARMAPDSVVLAAPARMAPDRRHRADQGHEQHLSRLRTGRSDHQPAAAAAFTARRSPPISAIA